jgi:ubiquinone/menaquinone biosynthesis C-methylase UbiE
MTNEELHRYWEQLSRDHLKRSDNGFEVICFAGMPQWFNRFIHRYQVKGFLRLVAGQSFAGCDVLDVGTGIGRWARWYATWHDARVTGIDLEPERLNRARQLGGGPQYASMSADRLTFEDGSFDIVNCITVLQHTPHETKRAAVREMARVLRPGGRVVIMEVTDVSDDAPHVFPWTQRDWRSCFEANGFVVKRTVGEQYIPVLRALKSAHRLLHRQRARSKIDAMKNGHANGGFPANMVALRAAVLASYPVEELLRFLPETFARTTGFVLEKPL